MRHRQNSRHNQRVSEREREIEKERSTQREWFVDELVNHMRVDEGGERWGWDTDRTADTTKE
jgi:hypothetical protein